MNNYLHILNEVRREECTRLVEVVPLEHLNITRAIVVEDDVVQICRLDYPLRNVCTVVGSHDHSCAVCYGIYSRCTEYRVCDDCVKKLVFAVLWNGKYEYVLGSTELPENGWLKIAPETYKAQGVFIGQRCVYASKFYTSSDKMQEVVSIPSQSTGDVNDVMVNEVIRVGLNRLTVGYTVLVAIGVDVSHCGCKVNHVKKCKKSYVLCVPTNGICKKYTELLHMWDTTDVVRYGGNGHCTHNNRLIEHGRPCCDAYVKGLSMIQDLLSKTDKISQDTYNRLSSIYGGVVNRSTFGFVRLDLHHTITSVPRFGVMSQGVMTIELDRYLYIYGLSAQIDRIRALVYHVATYEDILKCRELIQRYDLGYVRESVLLALIGNRKFVPMGLFGCSARGDLMDCEPIVYYTTPTAVVLRSSTGYQVYGEADESVCTFIKETPYQYQVPIRVKPGMIICDPATVVDNFLRDLTLLNTTEAYQQLQYCIVMGYKKDICHSLLRLSHCMNYGERPSTRCIVISGRPGCGKSHIVSECTRDRDIYTYRYDPRAKNFFSGYHGQDIVVIDDLGHYAPTEWTILKDLITTTMVPLPMSHVNYIGRIPFVSSLIMITTNCLAQILCMSKELRGALTRRFVVLDMDTYIYRIYRPSVNMFVGVCDIDKDTVVNFVKGLLPMDCELTGDISLFAKGQALVSTIVELPIPYMPLVRIAYGKLRAAMMYACRVVNIITGHQLECGFVNRNCNIIPREYRRRFYALPKNLQGYVHRSIQKIWRIYTGAYDYDRFKQVLAEAENGVLSYDLTRPYHPVSEVICGKSVDSIDLTPYIRPVIRKRVYGPVEPEYVKVDERTLAIYPEIREFRTFDGSGYLTRGSPGYVHSEKGFKLMGLPDDSLYANDIFRVQFAPLNRRFCTEIDESEYKPNCEIKEVLKMSQLNMWVHKAQGKSHTTRRREERRRAKLRSK